MSSTAKPLKALVSASIRGLLSLCPASVSTLPGQLGDEALDVLGDRAAHPVLGYGVGHAVAAEQHLLVVERQAGDLPAHREALEEQLRATAPGVVLAGRRRSRLRSPCRRFCSKRRRRAARLGLVGRRLRGTVSPAAIFSASRCRANSRLRAWPRASWDTATTTGPTRSCRRARCASSSPAEARTSKTASTREAVTFACCPPGPEDRLARSSTSASGIASPASILSSSATGPP